MKTAGAGRQMRDSQQLVNAIAETGQSFWRAHETILTDTIVCICIIVAAFIINRLGRRSIRSFSRRHNLPETDPGAETRFRMISRLLGIVIWLIAVGLVFWVVNIPALNSLAKGIFASAGVAGIALGFAAQSTVANLFSGIVIAFAQPIRLGDSVTIDDEYGTVENIGLFYTSIRIWDNRRLVIPNKLLGDKSIRNYTLVDPRMPAIVVLRLQYGADVEAVRALLLEEARLHRLFLTEPPPSVQVIEADNLGVTVRLMAWSASQADAWTLSTDVREAALAKLPGIAAPVGLSWTGSGSQAAMRAGEAPQAVNQ
jgi:small conductance mechanosensitive channel